MKRRPPVMPFIVWIWTLSMILSACAPSGVEIVPRPHSVSFFAMDTFMEFTAYDNGLPDTESESGTGADMNALMEEAKETVRAVESVMSATNPDSGIYQVNRDGGGEVSAETADLLRNALDLCALTGGALDISIYPIVRAWGFTTDTYRIPSDEEVSGLLEQVDYQRVRLDGLNVGLEPGTQIDPGAVAKGYAGKKAAELLRENGVESALLNLGGNIQTVGGKPDGSLWRIGVQDPDDTSNYIGVFSMADRAAVTSGGYQRYFTGPDGTLYWHIMDPETGHPARKGLLSVTIVGRDGTMCDALSTALFVMGPAGAEAFWRAHRDLDFEMVLITEDREVLVTPGLDFQLAAPEAGYYLRVLEE